MDAASILVLILVAGVAALFIWLELNSRRNDAQKKKPTPVQGNPDSQQMEKPTSESEKQKAA